jgi:hypothetical protein
MRKVTILKLKFLRNTWQAYAERKYGLTEKLFINLNKKVYLILPRTGRVTVYFLKFGENPAFENFMFSEDYKVEQRKESEIEQR